MANFPVDSLFSFIVASVKVNRLDDVMKCRYIDYKIKKIPGLRKIQRRRNDWCDRHCWWSCLPDRQFV